MNPPSEADLQLQDFFLVLNNTTALFDSWTVAVAAFNLGLAMAVNHPEWVQAFMRQTTAPDATPVMRHLLATVPLEVTS